MLTQPSADRRAWRADTIDDPHSWNYPLPERTLAALDPMVRQGRDSRTVTDLRIPAQVHAVLAEDFRPIKAALESGRGWAIVTPGPAGRYSPPELQALYWLIGQFLGRPW